MQKHTKKQYKESKHHPHHNQVKEVIKQSKNNKSQGPDKLNIRHMKHIGPLRLAFLMSMLKTALNTNTISLMSHVTKLVLRIVINRIRGRTLDEIAPVQYGFMPDKGTGNAIFVLRRLVETSVEKKRDVYTCFIDYSKAFDTVKHESLVKLLQSLDIDKSETRLLTNLYWKQTAAVRCGDDISEWLDIKQGVRQGCVAFPPLVCIVHGDDYEGTR